jgi:hypothetical protein
MNIGLSMNKIKELAGGGASGVTPWREHASAKGTGQIQLPTKWTEIKIVTCNSSGLACFSSTLTYEEYQNNVAGKNYFTTFEGYNDSNFAKWCCYPKYVYLEDYHYASDQTTSCTTTVYYKEVLENVVNIGMESNWELWGSVTGNTAITLPSDWEEIMICAYDTDYQTYSPMQVIQKDYIKNVLTNQSSLEYGFISPNSIAVSYNITNTTIALYRALAGSTNYINNFKTTIYYKKKCDNVLDINDMGEWKLISENLKNNDIYLSDLSSYNEIMLVGCQDGNARLQTFIYPLDIITKYTTSTNNTNLLFNRISSTEAHAFVTYNSGNPILRCNDTSGVYPMVYVR